MTAKGSPDVEMGGSARARRVRFTHVPDTEVRFRGQGAERSERRNLPDDIEPGVTYRDVRVAWRADARAVDTKSEEQPRKES